MGVSRSHTVSRDCFGIQDWLVSTFLWGQYIVNAVSKFDTNLMLRINKLLDWLGVGYFYLTLDLTRWYWQTPWFLWLSSYCSDYIIVSLFHSGLVLPQRFNASWTKSSALTLHTSWLIWMPLTDLTNKGTHDLVQFTSFFFCRPTHKSRIGSHVVPDGGKEGVPSAVNHPF